MTRQNDFKARQTHFKDQLLEQLKGTLAERPAPSDPKPHPAFGRRRRARLAFAAGCCTAALAAVAIVVSSSDVTSRAYAVESAPSGLVRVSINRLEDGQGLQQSLREAGVPAVVEFNDRSDLPPLRDQPGVPPQFRAVIPSDGNWVGCMGRLPGLDTTVELPYPESLAHLAELDPSLRATLQAGTEKTKERNLRELKRTLSPKGWRRIMRIEREPTPPRILKLEREHPPTTPTIPPFTFVPTEDLVPPTDDAGVTFIIDPKGLEAGESLHIVTTGGSLRSMTAFSRNAVCIANGGFPK